jgi:hypothetical protein
MFFKDFTKMAAIVWDAGYLYHYFAPEKGTKTRFATNKSLRALGSEAAVAKKTDTY